MTRDEIKSIVFQVISDEMGVELNEISEETDLYRDLGADSLDSVEIVMELEGEFEDLTVSDEDAEMWRTIKDIIDFVERRLAD